MTENQKNQNEESSEEKDQKTTRADVNESQEDSKADKKQDTETESKDATPDSTTTVDTPEAGDEQDDKKSRSGNDDNSNSMSAHAEEVKNFDWDSVLTEVEEYTPEEKKEMERLYEETLTEIEERQLVTGSVVAMTEKDVVLNIGFKSDGLVQRSEFKDEPDVKVGDEIEVFVEKKEDQEGQILLSRKKAIAERSWQTIVDAFDNETIIQGHITGRTKGGMIVRIMGLDAFLPGSQLDVKPIKDYDSYVGMTMDLKVVKLNKDFRNIVVSHKAIIESDLELQKTEILSKLEKGQVLEGIVKNLISFGVFVDLGGVDGLIHITDVSWGRINHPEEVLELGQKINVVVLDYDEEKKRISLGLKQLTSHPWKDVENEIKEGDIVEGKVVNIEDYGAFVEIRPGVEGLVHVSEMSWSQNLKSPEEYVREGETVKSKVLNIDIESRKLSLGIKQLSPDPWENAEEAYKVGSVHNSVIRSITNFGLFVEMEEGVDGLVHVSDLSWTRKYGHPKEFASVGDELKVVVLEVDKENRRLSLGHKQLEEDPWDTFESIFLPESEHEAVVKSADDKGVVVELPYGVEAYVPPRHSVKEDKSRPKKEDTIIVRILEFDKDNHRIVASHTDIWKDEERKQKQAGEEDSKKESDQTKKDIKKVKSGVSKSTIADEVEGLEALKTQFREDEEEKQKEAIEKMEKSKSGKDSKKKEDDETASGTAKKKSAKKTTSSKKKTTTSKKKDDAGDKEDSGETDGKDKSEDDSKS